MTNGNEYFVIGLLNPIIVNWNMSDVFRHSIFTRGYFLLKCLELNYELIFPPRGVSCYRSQHGKWGYIFHRNLTLWNPNENLKNSYLY